MSDTYAKLREIYEGADFDVGTPFQRMFRVVSDERVKPGEVVMISGLDPDNYRQWSGRPGVFVDPAALDLADSVAAAGYYVWYHSGRQYRCRRHELDIVHNRCKVCHLDLESIYRAAQNAPKEDSMRVYEFVISYVPNAENAKAGKKPALITPTPVLLQAKDDGHAKFLAGRAVPQEHTDAVGSGEIRIDVRPFV